MSLIKKTLLIVFFLGLGSLFLAKNQFVHPQNTLSTYNLTQVSLTEGYTLFSENDNFRYYYKKHNGTLKIEDKRNGYSWTSGIDHDYDQFIERSVDAYLLNNPTATPVDILNNTQPLEDQMNTTREGIANSLIVLDMLKSTDAAKSAIQAGSSYKAFKVVTEGGISSVVETSDSMNTDNLYSVDGEDNHFVFDIQFIEYDVHIRLHLYIYDKGITYKIFDEEITGEESNYINFINIMPFMGSYGGKQLNYNVDTEKWDILSYKTRHEGYVFVPDGPGAIIDYKDYDSSLSGYTGLVYGNNLAQSASNIGVVSSVVPLKNPLMPVFGIAYPSESAAFVSYATEGDAYMQIVSRPNDSSDSYNLTNYTISYPRFLFNQSYKQVYNQAGDTFIALFEDRNHYNISLNYEFLSEEANYIGMAKSYQNYLINTNQITKKTTTLGDIPIRLDFIMSDAKKTLLGTEDVVVTSISETKNILNDLYTDGIRNINSGLYGYQTGGITLGSKSTPDYKNSIGSEGAIQATIEDFSALGMDISLALDYAMISDDTDLTSNVNKHYNGKYMFLFNPLLVSAVSNVSYYAKPTRMVDFIEKNATASAKLNAQSITYDGVTNLLYSDYSKSGNNLNESISMYQDALSTVNSSFKVNGTTPNQYLWNVTDRFLQTPMFSSQYIVETETVPFLQMVLNGYIELYSIYVNLSFYEQKDILKMIDFNTNPSFILTNEPSYLLQNTNSQNYFSTEYSINKALIETTYITINQALKEVSDATWINRINVSDGVYVNTYDNGTQIVINYSDEPVVYLGHIIAPVNYLVIGG